MNSVLKIYNLPMSIFVTIYMIIFALYGKPTNKEWIDLAILFKRYMLLASTIFWILVFHGLTRFI